MNWLFPGFLAGAALIGLPVILHLLRRQPRELVRFPSLRFLGESALRDTRQNRLLRWLTLLLRCLAIALLCAAFARPFWGASPASDRRALVIALDNSMSQQTRGRWDDTQRWSLSQLNELKPGDEAALLVMEPEPLWVVPMSDDLTRVRTALAAAKPGYDKTRYAQPLRLAADALAKTDAGTKILAWAADEQRAGWRGTDLAQKLPPWVSFRFIGASPAPQRQAAIIGLRTSAQDQDKETLEVTIRQFQPASDKRELTVYAGENPIAKVTVSLQAGDNKLNIACVWPTEAVGLRATLDPDDLPADDSAWIAATTVATNTVLLDAPLETDYIAHALRSTRKLTGTEFEPAPLPDHAWPLGSPVVLRSPTSFASAALERLNQFCDAGGAVFVFADGSAAQTDWLEQRGVRVTERQAENDAWHLRDWDPEHPVLAAFAGQSLLQVEFHRGFNLAGDTLATIANWPDGRVALGEIESGGRRLLIAGFPPERAATDWMTRPSFVPFVHCAVRWLGSLKDARDDWRVGDNIPLPDNEGIWRALDSPAPQKEVAVNGSVRPAMPGLYQFTGRSVKKVFAVNTPVEESDLTPWPNPDQLTALESSAAPAAISRIPSFRSEWVVIENRQRMWWWLLVGGGCMLLAEILLANRVKL